jgi:hypothetical protein
LLNSTNHCMKFPLHFHCKIDHSTYLPVTVYCIKPSWYEEAHHEELKNLLKKLLNEKLTQNQKKIYEFQKENSLENIKGKLIEFQYEFKNYTKYNLILESGKYSPQTLTNFELILNVSQSTSIKNFLK